MISRTSWLFFFFTLFLSIIFTGGKTSSLFDERNPLRTLYIWSFFFLHFFSILESRRRLARLFKRYYCNSWSLRGSIFVLICFYFFFVVVVFETNHLSSHLRYPFCIFSVYFDYTFCTSLNGIGFHIFFFFFFLSYYMSVSSQRICKNFLIFTRKPL